MSGFHIVLVFPTSHSWDDREPQQTRGKTFKKAQHLGGNSMFRLDLYSKHMKIDYLEIALLMKLILILPWWYWNLVHLS